MWRANPAFKLYCIGPPTHTHTHIHSQSEAFDSLPNDLQNFTSTESHTPNTHSPFPLFFLSKRDDKDLVKVVRGISFSAEMSLPIASVLRAD